MEVRLNSPRAKFQITNMADDQVDLNPEDIPGATTSCKNVEILPRKNDLSCFKSLLVTGR